MFFLIATLFSLAAAHPNLGPNPEEMAELQLSRQTHIINTWDGPYYFPNEATEHVFIDEFENRYVSYFLDALNEPILFEEPAKDTPTIRFSFFGSWSGPRVFRIEANDQGANLLRIETTTTFGGWGPIETIVRSDLALSNDEYDAIVTLANAVRPCQVLPAERLGFDGYTWYLEVKTQDQYCAISRWVPEPGPWQDLAAALEAITAAQ